MEQKKYIAARIGCIALTILLIASLFVPNWGTWASDQKFTWLCFQPYDKGMLTNAEYGFDNNECFAEYLEREGDSLRAKLAKQYLNYVYGDVNKKDFRALEGVTGPSHFLAVFSGLAYFGCSVWLLVLSVLSLVLHMKERTYRAAPFFSVPLSILAIIFGFFNPYLHTGTPAPIVISIIACTLFLFGCSEIVTFFQFRKAAKKEEAMQ